MKTASGQLQGCACSAELPQQPLRTTQVNRSSTASARWERQVGSAMNSTQKTKRRGEGGGEKGGGGEIVRRASALHELRRRQRGERLRGRRRRGGGVLDELGLCAVVHHVGRCTAAAVAVAGRPRSRWGTLVRIDALHHGGVPSWDACGDGVQAGATQQQRCCWAATKAAASETCDSSRHSISSASQLQHPRICCEAATCSSVRPSPWHVFYLERKSVPLAAQALRAQGS